MEQLRLEGTLFIHAVWGPTPVEHDKLVGACS